MYASKTNENTIQKGKAYTEVSTTEAKDNVVVGGAVKLAVKERGPHRAALRQVQHDAQTVFDSKQIQSKAPKKQLSLLMEDETKLHVDNQCSKDNHKENGLCPSEHVTGWPIPAKKKTIEAQ